MKLNKARDAIYELIDDNYETVKTVQSAWMKKVAEQELKKNGTANGSLYEFRLEFSGVSFRARWLRVTFIKQKGGIKRLTNNITCPSVGRYKSSQFPEASDWELELIKEMEDILKEIRDELKHLMKAHRNLIFAAKASGSNLESIPIAARVEKQTDSIKKFKERLQ